VDSLVAVTEEERDLIDGKPFTLTPWITPLKITPNESRGDWPRYG
jgi:hypothetical protein